MKYAIYGMLHTFCRPHATYDAVLSEIILNQSICRTAKMDVKFEFFAKALRLRLLIMIRFSHH